MHPKDSMALSRDERDSTAAKTRAELGTMIPSGPTSIADEAMMGGAKTNPSPSGPSAYEGGNADDDAAQVSQRHTD